MKIKVNIVSESNKQPKNHTGSHVEASAGPSRRNRKNKGKGVKGSKGQALQTETSHTNNVQDSGKHPLVYSKSRQRLANKVQISKSKMEKGLATKKDEESTLVNNANLIGPSAYIHTLAYPGRSQVHR